MRAHEHALDALEHGLERVGQRRQKAGVGLGRGGGCSGSGVGRRGCGRAGEIQQRLGVDVDRGRRVCQLGGGQGARGPAVLLAGAGDEAGPSPVVLLLQVLLLLLHRSIPTESRPREAASRQLLLHFLNSRIQLFYMVCVDTVWLEERGELRGAVSSREI